MHGNQHAIFLQYLISLSTGKLITWSHAYSISK